MKSYSNLLKEQVIELRQQGRTYHEIQEALRHKLSKGTLSNWCKNTVILPIYKERIKKIVQLNAEKARKKAVEVNKSRRQAYLHTIFDRNKHLSKVLKEDNNVIKIALAMLYLGEGRKSLSGSLMFGNSEPLIIRLFLRFLRTCYDIDESKFRCTVQCRADQNISQLELFWSNITKIPSNKFYKARIDPRTIGKVSKKIDYKGVCRIDYFSSEIKEELKQIASILDMGM